MLVYLSWKVTILYSLLRLHGLAAQEEPGQVVERRGFEYYLNPERRLQADAHRVEKLKQPSSVSGYISCQKSGFSYQLTEAKEEHMTLFVVLLLDLRFQDSRLNALVSIEG